MSEWSRVFKKAWMLSLYLVPLLFVGSAAGAQHNGPACDKVPDLGWAGKTVQQVVSDANSKWSDQKWRIVAKQDYDDVKTLAVTDVQPTAGSGLTMGQLMHIYIAGSGDKILGTPGEKGAVAVLVLISLWLAWRCWKK